MSWGLHEVFDDSVEFVASEVQWLLARLPQAFLPSAEGFEVGSCLGNLKHMAHA